MIAFVFTGGGSRGPLQAGAAHALLAAGIAPDMVVGTSAGALNAVFLAAWGPTSAAAQRLAQAWTAADKRTAMPGGLFAAARRLLLRADSLYASSGLRSMLEAHLPPHVRTFGDMQIPCYVTASDLRSRRLFLFGEDPSGPVIDAALASSAIPGVYPPVAYYDLQLVDGGLVDNVPASVAMDKGATTIYLINVGYGGQIDEAVRGILAIVDRSIGAFLAQSLFTDLERARQDPTVVLHHIYLADFPEVGMLDFGHTAAMLVRGQEATRAYLDNPAPHRSAAPSAGFARPAPSIPGLREWSPRRP